MNLSRILAVAKKETVHIMRDWRSLLMAIGAPVILLILFGYALTLDVDRVPLIIWDQDNTPESRHYLSLFEGSRYFDLIAYTSGYREIEEAIDHSEAIGALVIPGNFAQKVNGREPVSVQMILDGSDSNTATISLAYAEAVTQDYSKNLMIKEFSRAGLSPPRQGMELKSRIWFNGNGLSTYSVIPGLIAVIMMVNSALLTSLTIAREWEQGTMEQLIASPIKISELFFGKLLPYFAIGMLDVAIIMVMGDLLFDVPIRGSLVFLFAITTIFLIGSLSLGLVISIVTKTQLLASQLAMVATFLPSILLSGFLSSIFNLPYLIQAASYVVPARYFVTLLRGIYLKGIGIQVAYFEVILLTAFAVLMVVIGNLIFKKKLVS